MAAYSQEQRARAVAEYWLCGSYRLVARVLNIGDHGTVCHWVCDAESPKTSRHSRLRMRAEELFEDRKTRLEAAAQRALELQMRHLPCAAFRDRTHFLKVASELMLLGNGKPTSTTEHRAEDEQLDSEIRHLLEEMALRERGSGRDEGEGSGREG